MAVGLIAAASAWWASFVALGLNGIFVSIVGYNLFRGRRPKCHCFGELSSSPIGWRTLVLNLSMVAAATIVAWRGRAEASDSLFQWVGPLTIGERMTGILLILVLAMAGLGTWLLMQMLAQQGRILLRLETLEQTLDKPPRVKPRTKPVEETTGLTIGTAAPDFSLADARGGTASLESLRSGGKPPLLAFTDPNCAPCNRLLPALGQWAQTLSMVLETVVVSRGDTVINRSKAEMNGLTTVLIQADREVATAFGIEATPAMVLVTPDGRIGSRTAVGPNEIEELMNHIRSRPGLSKVARSTYPTEPQSHRANGPVGERGREVPNVALPNLSGDIIDLHRFRGRPFALVFWNPNCSHCNAMLSDLKTWEELNHNNQASLVLISSGSPAQIRQLGLQATVFLDPQFTVGALRWVPRPVRQHLQDG